MLIYLDANIVQYCADYGDFVFGRDGSVQPPNHNLKMELCALGDVIELAVRAEVQDLDHRWDVAAPIHLLEELCRGNLSQEQVDTYRSLREAWQDLGIEEHGSPDVEVVNTVETKLRRLNLRDPPDRRHLAEAVAIGASWFITLDKDIIKKTRDEPSKPTMIEGRIKGGRIKGVRYFFWVFLLASMLTATSNVTQSSFHALFYAVQLGLIEVRT